MGIAPRAVVIAKPHVLGTAILYLSVLARLRVSYLSKISFDRMFQARGITMGNSDVDKRNADRHSSIWRERAYTY